MIKDLLFAVGLLMLILLPEHPPIDPTISVVAHTLVSTSSSGTAVAPLRQPQLANTTTKQNPPATAVPPFILSENAPSTPDRTPTYTPAPNLVQCRENGVLCFKGYLSFYTQAVTDAQIAHYLTTHPAPPQGTAYIAVANCDAVGLQGYMLAGGTRTPVTVFDCAGSDSHNWMLENLIAAEIDWYTERRLGVAHEWAEIYLED